LSGYFIGDDGIPNLGIATEMLGSGDAAHATTILGGPKKIAFQLDGRKRLRVIGWS